MKKLLLLIVAVFWVCNTPAQSINVTFIWYSTSTAQEYKFKAFYSESYRLQVSEDSTFSTTLFDSVLPDTIHTVTGLSNLKKYYWRVCAVNEAGTGPWSEVRWFGTAPKLPPIVLLKSPLMGAINVKQ